MQGSTARKGAAAAVALLILVLLLGCVPSGRPSSDPDRVPDDTACDPLEHSEARYDVTRRLADDVGRLAFGVASEGGFASPGQWDETARSVGEEPLLIMAYADFTDEVPLAGLEAVAARGAVPVVTWEPWDPTAGPDQSRFSLASIIRGDHDPYLQRWAGTLDAYGRPVILRLAHEMNMPWYPWGAGVGENTPGEYVEAWRHVHRIFEEQGASHVSWMWNPEAPRCPSSLLEELYPGDRYVDLVALDGYNWGTGREDEVWRTPKEIFGVGLEQLGRLAPDTPILIGETASAESGGSKADWISDLVGYLAEQPRVEGFIWFDHRKETDWRISSSEASRRAFAEALAVR